MNFFDGQNFPVYGSFPGHRGCTRNVPLYFGIQYNHCGRMFLKIDGGEELAAEGPHVFITHPGAFFEYGAVDGRPRHHCFICSYGPRIERYISDKLLELNPDPPLLPVASPERFLLTMLEIMSLLRKSAATPPRAVWLYEELLLQIQESRERRKMLPPFQSEQLTELASRIRHHPELEYDFEAEAGRCCVTTTHFRRIFRRLHGVPPQQFLIHCRLEKAAELLLHSGRQIAEVAELSGIPNCYYFSRLFREKYRVSPSEYRRNFS